MFKFEFLYFYILNHHYNGIYEYLFIIFIKSFIKNYGKILIKYNYKC